MTGRSERSGIARLSVGRLFLMTAVVSIVGSVGFIAGQHLLLKDDLSPVVSANQLADRQAEAEATSDDEPNELGETERLELFSFYDALTSPQVVESPSELTDDGEPGVHPMDDPEQGEAEPEILASGALLSPRAHEDFDFESVAPQTDDGSEPGRFTLQIASHSSVERARAEMDRLRRMGLEPHLVAAHIEDMGTHYRVRIGRFPTDEAARAYRTRLAGEHGLHAFVTPL